jgi:hypothetical protein
MKIKRFDDLLSEYDTEGKTRSLIEDVPANNVSSGNVAGIVPREDPPVFDQEKDKKKLKGEVMLKRFNEFINDDENSDKSLERKDKKLLLEPDSDKEFETEGCSKDDLKMKHVMNDEYGKEKGDEVFYKTKNKRKND